MMGDNVSPWLCSLWLRHRETALRLAVATMAGVALIWLSYECFRFAWQPIQIGGRRIHPGALDLEMVHELTGRWFRGEPIYRTFRDATHPPASYALFWPLVGWTGMAGTRVVWALTAAISLVVLIRIGVRASRADTKLERTVMILLPLAMYATGATIGNGQTTIHVMALTAGALVCLHPDVRRSDGSPPGTIWTSRRAATQGGTVTPNLCGGQVLAALLFLGALMKPAVSAPFFWIIVFVPESLWPAALVIIAYAGATLFSASFQDGGLVSLFSQWLTRGTALGAEAGESNLHIWLSTLGFERWMLPASLVALAVLGVWVYRHRRRDLWVLMGVTAITARFWAYHRWYDDLLLLFTLTALFRIAKTSRQGNATATWAGVLFAVTLASTLAPGGLYVLADPWRQVYLTCQTAIWASDLVFLVAVVNATGGGSPAQWQQHQDEARLVVRGSPVIAGSR